LERRREWCPGAARDEFGTIAVRLAQLIFEVVEVVVPPDRFGSAGGANALDHGIVVQGVG
jgi:hypothetical protein